MGGKPQRLVGNNGDPGHTNATFYSERGQGSRQMANQDRSPRTILPRERAAIREERVTEGERGIGDIKIGNRA